MSISFFYVKALPFIFQHARAYVLLITKGIDRIQFVSAHYVSEWGNHWHLLAKPTSMTLKFWYTLVISRVSTPAVAMMEYIK